MLTLQVVNVSDGEPISDYRYTVYINRDVISTGSIRDHKREDGWASLVKQIAEEHIAAGFKHAYGCSRTILPDDLADVPACGAQKNGRICVTPAPKGPGQGHKCKFVKIIPAKKPGVRRGR
jgi:hypothetical protein